MPEDILQPSAGQTPAPATRYRFFLLFIFLLAYLIFYPYAETSVAGYTVFRMLAVAITVLSVYAVSFRRSVAIVAVALAVPALLHRVEILRNDASALAILNMCLTFAFDAFIITVLFHRVFIRGRHDSEAVFGALSVYLLLGFGFSNIYGLLEKLQAHAFYLDPATNLHADARSRRLYLLQLRHHDLAGCGGHCRGLGPGAITFCYPIDSRPAVSRCSYFKADERLPFAGTTWVLTAVASAVLKGCISPAWRQKTRLGWAPLRDTVFKWYGNRRSNQWRKRISP